MLALLFYRFSGISRFTYLHSLLLNRYRYFSSALLHSVHARFILRKPFSNRKGSSFEIRTKIEILSKTKNTTFRVYG